MIRSLLFQILNLLFLCVISFVLNDYLNIVKWVYSWDIIYGIQFIEQTELTCILMIVLLSFDIFRGFVIQSIKLILYFKEEK